MTSVTRTKVDVLRGDGARLQQRVYSCYSGCVEFASGMWLCAGFTANADNMLSYV